MKKKAIMILMTVLTTLSASAQRIAFASAEFEEAIRQHLGMDAEAEITQDILEDITTISFSGLGITDIGDIVYLPNVKKLDLSGNNLSDLSPLLVLEKLEELNLSDNGLENINQLIFVSADGLNINIGHNHISDFSNFNLPMEQQLTLWGIDTQTAKDAAYLKVTQLYAKVSNSGELSVVCSGRTNGTNTIRIICGQTDDSVPMDGDTHVIALSQKPEMTTPVTLTNGEQSEMTYIVPPANYLAGAGKTVTLETGLPEDYTLFSVYASKGTVEVEGTKLKYTAPETAEPDVIHFSYYQGATLKGFSRYYLNRGNTLGDVNHDDSVTMTDVVKILSYILGDSPNDFDETVADLNGDGVVTITDVIILIVTYSLIP